MMPIHDARQPIAGGEPLQPRDALGRLIRPGDVITYPGRTGSTVWMNIAIVRGMHTEQLYDWRRPDLILELERLTKVRDRNDLIRDFGPYYLARKATKTKHHELATITGLSEDEAATAVLAGKGWR